MTGSCRTWVYARPLNGGGLRVENFALRECAMPEPKVGEALVRVKLINLHSATRSRMLGGATKLGETDLSNYACAQVLRSRDPVFREGDLIACQAGWQDHQIVRGADAAIGYPAPSTAVQTLNRTRSQWTYVFRPELAAAWSPAVLMDVFGTSGLTAWFGVRQCGPVTPAEVVAVGGTTGSVGAIVAQLAKAAGAQVIGFARGDDRCRWVVDTLGVDHCLDYAAADLDDRIAQVTPGEIDFLSDGIGGAFTERLVAAIAYGSAAAYYGDAPASRPASLCAMFGISPSVEQMLAARDIRSEAWIVDAFYHERLAAEDALSAMLRDGTVKPVHRVVRGFEAVPQAIVDLYRLPHAGKLQVSFE